MEGKHLHHFCPRDEGTWRCSHDVKEFSEVSSNLFTYKHILGTLNMMIEISNNQQDKKWGIDR